MMHTPRGLTSAVRAFATQLAGRETPTAVPLRPIAGAAALDCFAVVDRAISEGGGDQVLGWRIWENTGFWLEAEFHAVWRSPAGDLLDITPAQGEFDQTLFVPDPSLVYEGRQVNNRWWPLSGHPAIHDFIAAQQAQFELLNRGTRADQHGEIRLTGSEADELRARE